MYGQYKIILDYSLNYKHYPYSLNVWLHTGWPVENKHKIPIFYFVDYTGCVPFWCLLLIFANKYLIIKIKKRDTYTTVLLSEGKQYSHNKISVSLLVLIFLYVYTSGVFWKIKSVLILFQSKFYYSNDYFGLSCHFWQQTYDFFNKTPYIFVN